MAQKYTDWQNGGGAFVGTTFQAEQGLIQLSDGTDVWCGTDNTTAGVLLRYSADHTTDAALATVASSLPGCATICADSSDNIYCITDNAGAHTAYGLTKGSGHSWTVQTGMACTPSGSAQGIHHLAAVWCNTGGGTNSKGHIFVLMNDVANVPWYIILDAGVLLAGSGTAIVSSGSNPTFVGGGFGACDISADGFGATHGITCAYNSTGNMCVGSWAVNSSGALSTNTALPASSGVSFGVNGICRAIRVSSNLWAVIMNSPTTNSNWAIGRYSATAKLTEFTDCGTPTGASITMLAASHASDAFLDPVTPGKVWILSLGSYAGSSLTMARLGCSCSSGVTWDTAAIADDTLTSQAGTVSVVRANKEPRIQGDVAWQVDGAISPSSNYALFGDYTFFPGLSSPIVMVV